MHSADTSTNAGWPTFLAPSRKVGASNSATAGSHRVRRGECCGAVETLATLPCRKRKHGPAPGSSQQTPKVLLDLGGLQIGA
jgi:hypothetical protein